jgi:hypothetical protein
MSSHIVIVEIPDGTDHAHWMGRTNREVTLTGVEVTVDTLNDLLAAWDAETLMVLNIPDFEEEATVRITNIVSIEKKGIPPQHIAGIGSDSPPSIYQVYYEITITIVTIDISEPTPPSLKYYEPWNYGPPTFAAPLYSEDWNYLNPPTFAVIFSEAWTT